MLIYPTRHLDTTMQNKQNTGFGREGKVYTELLHLFGNPASGPDS
jgi:hypothetical protein